MVGLSLIERGLVFYGTRVVDHPRKWWLHTRLRRLFNVSIDQDIDVVREGLHWSLNPADFGHDSLFWLGTKDRWDIYHLRRLVPPDSVILDVGANFGYYSLTIAHALKSHCQIHAIEPNPSNFDRLQRHIKLNGFEGSIQPYCFGVSDHPETVNMSQPADNSGHTAVAANGEIRGVALTTLDDFCETRGLNRLDVLVLDVEGLEERALRGAARTIARCRPLIFVELFPPVMQLQGSSPGAATQILTSLGYELFAARRTFLEPLSVMPTGDVRKNAFGFHRDRLPDFLRTVPASSH